VADATGKARKPPLRVTFDCRLKLEFHGAKITSDGGLRPCPRSIQTPDGIILDLDGSESPAFDQQEGAADNGHFRCTC
jgi:hypothetical protein